MQMSTNLECMTISPAQMALAASDAAALMKSLSNEHRLLILCHLIDADEMTVGELVSKIGLSQSALSQHLARLRAEGVVSFRREAQTLFYRVSDERAASVLLLLHQMFCPDPNSGIAWKSPMVRADRPREEDSKGS
jgi:DNA-binding transcriptional ArsR family regulator